MPQLIWYFDVISPFAYLSLPRIEALAQTHPVALRPIVFGAVLSHWKQLGPAEIAPKRLHTYRLCQFMADRMGVKLRFPPAHPFRSLDTLRLLDAIGASPAAVRGAFEFIWAEGRDPVAERDALTARLSPAAQFDALIAQTGAKTRLRDATDKALAAGVFGVPTLAVGERLFWGFDALPMAEAYLADSRLFDTGEMARLTALPVGVERR